MMIDPPIDELATKVGGNKYKLTCLMAKRAKELERIIPSEIATSDKKSISIAADEIMNNEIVAGNNQDEE